MADTKLTALTALTTPSLDDLIYTVDDPAGTPASRKTTIAELMTATGLLHTAGPADGNQTMAVGVMYVTNISGYTADRTFTLPATAAVGDRCGIILSAGDDAFELLITAAAGDTLNGIAGGTEWSRLFIDYECVIFRCVAASATWVVEYDGRIPQHGMIHLTTSADGETASTFTRPTAASSAGAWTALINRGSCVTTSTDRITARRAGKYLIAGNGLAKDALSTTHFWGWSAHLNGTQQLNYGTQRASGTAAPDVPSAFHYSLAAGDYIDYRYRSQAGSVGALGDANVLYCTLAMLEVLP